MIEAHRDSHRKAVGWATFQPDGVVGTMRQSKEGGMPIEIDVQKVKWSGRGKTKQWSDLTIREERDKDERALEMTFGAYFERECSWAGTRRRGNGPRPCQVGWMCWLVGRSFCPTIRALGLRKVGQ